MKPDIQGFDMVQGFRGMAPCKQIERILRIAIEWPAVEVLLPFMKYLLAYTKERYMVLRWKLEHLLVDVLAKLEWQAKESGLRWRGKSPDHGGPQTRNGCTLSKTVA
jgi:hypothetical protein